MNKTFLGLSICAAIFAGNVFAETVTSGDDCGENCHWSYDADTKTLTISGTGEMASYGGESSSGRWRTTAPWKDLDEQITNLKIENGITALGRSAFEGLINLTNVDIPNSVSEIGYAAFYDSRSLTEITLPDNPNFTSVYGSFYGMNALKDIVVPDSVTTIGAVSFTDCWSLNSLVISDKMNLGEGLFNWNDDVRIDFSKLKIYCIGDTAVCDEKLRNAGYPDVQSIKATSQNVNGVTYITDKNGNVVAMSGSRPNKRIYTVEEATILSKQTGNTIKLRYK